MNISNNVVLGSKYWIIKPVELGTGVVVDVDGTIVVVVKFGLALTIIHETPFKLNKF